MRAAVIRSVQASLRRMGRTHFDLMQFHNRTAHQRQPERDVAAVSDLDAVVSAFETLQQQGKIRYWGMAGLAPTDVLQEVIAGGHFPCIQIPYNLINPSAGNAVPNDFPFQDFAQVIDQAAQQNMGVIAIRILAAGALAGVIERHPVADRSVVTIASSPDYASDVAQARRYNYLVEDASVSSLVEAAIRFAISKPGISTAILGISSMEQLEQAVKFVERGPLPTPVLDRMRATWSQTG
jgi:aryl-alcohol dehydrogenase-like predicted oxidoreductase